MGIRKFFRRDRNWFNFFVNGILFNVVLLAVSLFVPAYYSNSCSVPSFFHPFGRGGEVCLQAFIRGIDSSFYVLSYVLIFLLVAFAIYLFRKGFNFKRYIFPRKRFWIWLFIFSVFLFLWKGFVLLLIAILSLLFFLFFYFIQNHALIFLLWVVFLILLVILIRLIRGLWRCW